MKTPSTGVCLDLGVNCVLIRVLSGGANSVVIELLSADPSTNGVAKRHTVSVGERGRREWQRQFKSRASCSADAPSMCDRGHSTVGINDAMHNRKPKTSAFFARREEGIEDALACLQRNART
jgi:hypothetical protein